MEDGFTAADLATSLAGAATTVLPYVGAGVGAGLALMLLFVGIRKGIGFFKGVAK